MMKVNGSYTFNASKARVWALIHDPAALMQVIPGCQQIEKTGPAEYRGEIQMRLPAIVGAYKTYVRLAAFDEPDYCRLEGQVEGAPGAVRGAASFWLSETEGQTRLTYEGQGLITGPLANLNDRFAAGLVKTLIEQGLGRLARRLEGE